MTLLSIPFSEKDDLVGVYMGTAIERSRLGEVQNPWAKWAALVRPEHVTTHRERTLEQKVNIVAGTPQLYGTVANDSGDFPSGVRLEITKPDGRKLDTAHSFNDPDLNVVLGPLGSLHMFVVRNPAVGEWRITMTIRDDITDAHLVVSTTATADTFGQSEKALRKVMHDSESVPEELRELLAETAQGSFWCQLIFYGIAVIFFALVVALLSEASAVSATIAAVANFIGRGLTAARLTAFLKVSLPILTFLNATLGWLCQLVGFTSPPVEIEISHPVKQQTVSGTVPLEVKLDKGANKVTQVAYLVDDTPAGQSTQPPFTVKWLSTGVANGTHKVTATAIAGSTATNSKSVEFVVQNGSEPMEG